MAQLVYDFYSYKEPNSNSIVKVYFKNGELYRDNIDLSTRKVTSSEMISCSDAYYEIRDNEVLEVKVKVFTALDISKKQYICNSGIASRPEVSQTIKERIDNYSMNYSDFKWYYLKIKQHMQNQIKEGKYDGFADSSLIFYT